MRSKKNTLIGVPNLIFRSHLDIMFFTHVTSSKAVGDAQNMVFKLTDLMISFRMIYGFSELELPNNRLLTAYQRTLSDFRQLHKSDTN